MLERLKSRKFILAVVAALVVFVNSAFDFKLKTEEVILIVTSLLAFVGVEGTIDTVREMKKK